MDKKWLARLLITVTTGTTDSSGLKSSFLTISIAGMRGFPFVVVRNSKRFDSFLSEE